MEKYPRSSNYVHAYCLTLNYYKSLFEQFDFQDNRLDIENKINDVVINWTLGAFLDLELGHLPKPYIEKTSQNRD